MANKEALRELQHRLAQRMQAVRAEQPGQSWLAVDCAGQGLLFPLQHAGEIFETNALMPVPHTRPWVAGVANLRGGLHTVVDFAGFLGVRPPLAGRTPEKLLMVGFNVDLGLNCALLVDRLEGLRHAADLTRDDESAQDKPSFAAGRWLDTKGRAWQEIALNELAKHEMFLGIAG